MRQTRLSVNTKNGKYPIIIGANLSHNLSKVLKDNLISFNKCLLLIDSKIKIKIVKKLAN